MRGLLKEEEHGEPAMLRHGARAILALPLSLPLQQVARVGLSSRHRENL
jgi:hypothetical protein